MVDNITKSYPKQYCSPLGTNLRHFSRYDSLIQTTEFNSVYTLKPSIPQSVMEAPSSLPVRDNLVKDPITQNLSADDVKSASFSELPLMEKAPPPKSVILPETRQFRTLPTNQVANPSLLRLYPTLIPIYEYRFVDGNQYRSRLFPVRQIQQGSGRLVSASSFNSLTSSSTSNDLSTSSETLFSETTSSTVEISTESLTPPNLTASISSSSSSSERSGANSITTSTSLSSSSTILSGSMENTSAGPTTSTTTILVTQVTTDMSRSSSTRHKSSKSSYSSYSATTSGFDTYSTFPTTSSASSTVTTTIAATSGSLNDGNTSQGRHLPSGAIAAIVIVVVLAVAAVILYLIFTLRRRKRRNLHKDLHYTVSSGRSNKQNPDMRAISAYNPAVGASRNAPANGGSDESGGSRTPFYSAGVSRNQNQITSSYDSSEPLSASAYGASHTPNKPREIIKASQPQRLPTVYLGHDYRDARGHLNPDLSNPIVPVPKTPSDPSMTCFCLIQESICPLHQFAFTKNLPNTSLLHKSSRPSLDDLSAKQDARSQDVDNFEDGQANFGRVHPPSAWNPNIMNEKLKEVDEQRKTSLEQDQKLGSGSQTYCSSEENTPQPNNAYIGYTPFAVTSSHGHGSATTEEDEVDFYSASGSTSSHTIRQSSSISSRKVGKNERSLPALASLLHLQRQKPKNTDPEAHRPLEKGTSNPRTRNIRGESEASIKQYPQETENSSTVPPWLPSYGIIPPPPNVDTLTRQQGSINRNSPGPISLPYQPMLVVPDNHIPTFAPSPSTVFLPTPDAVLDPNIAIRLEEMARQNSRSTIGLRDDEDYSRPINPYLVGEYVQESRSSLCSSFSVRDGQAIAL